CARCSRSTNANDTSLPLTTTPKLLQAPLSEGDTVGSVKVKLAGQIIGEAPLRVPVKVEEPTLYWKLTHRVAGRVGESQVEQGG
ncbi:MAG TPA: hypothetical protein PLJ47_04925, partial [Candidatus Hydrogenedentes bacterium]|nr:hypothetical protein [Candidatus Hydrogenedentota bacterium]